MVSVSRIHYLASQALNGFETLDFETAVEMAKADLEAILADIAADAVPISGVEPVEVARHGELNIGERDSANPS